MCQLGYWNLGLLNFSCWSSPAALLPAFKLEHIIALLGSCACCLAVHWENAKMPLGTLECPGWHLPQ